MIKKQSGKLKFVGLINPWGISKKMFNLFFIRYLILNPNKNGLNTKNFLGFRPFYFQDF